MAFGGQDPKKAIGFDHCVQEKVLDFTRSYGGARYLFWGGDAFPLRRPPPPPGAATADLGTKCQLLEICKRTFMLESIK